MGINVTAMCLHFCCYYSCPQRCTIGFFFNRDKECARMDVSHFGWVANRVFDACMRLPLCMSELFWVFGNSRCVYCACLLVFPASSAWLLLLLRFLSVNVRYPSYGFGFRQTRLYCTRGRSFRTFWLHVVGNPLRPSKHKLARRPLRVHVLK